MENVRDYRRAVIIGINDYSKYSRSLHVKGDFSLHSGLNDARRMWGLVRQLGYAPANVRVLSAPRLSAADLGEGAEGVTFAGATLGEILHAAEWVAESLDRTNGVGWVSYSGHGGLTSDNEPFLCPENLFGSDLKNALPLTRLREQLKHSTALQGLTIVLDCCFARKPGAPASPAVKTCFGTPASAAVASAAEAFWRDQQGLIAAALPGQDAYEREFDGVMTGVLTWTLSQVLSQMQVERFGGVPGFTIGVTPLVRSAQQLCSALYVDQTPHLISGTGSYAPFGGPPGYAVPLAEPNGVGGPLEIWPGANGLACFSFQTANSGGTGYVTIQTTGTVPSGVPAGWFEVNKVKWWLPTGKSLADTFDLAPMDPTTLPSNQNNYGATTSTEVGYQASPATLSVSGGTLYAIQTPVGYGWTSATSAPPSKWWNAIAPTYLLGYNPGSAPSVLQFVKLSSTPSVQAYPLINQT